MRLLPLALGGALLATACESATTTSRGPPRVDELPRLSWTEEVRIGSRDDPETGFSRITGVEMVEDGTVYVLEGQALEIRVFSADGERLRTVGGPGQGPGEFRPPLTFGVTRDTLWVNDLGTRRVSWFGPDGTLVRETRFSPVPVDTDVSGLLLQVIPSRPLPGGLLESTVLMAVMGGAPNRPYSYPVVRFDRAGRVVDTLRWDTITPPPTVRIAGRALYPPALRPRNPLVVEVDGGRVVLGWSVPAGGSEGLLEMARVAVGRDTLARGRLRYEPIPTPASLEDSLMEGRERMASTLGVGEDELTDALRAGIHLPPYRPPLRSARVGREGGVWIQLTGPSPDSADWVVLDPDLTPRGRVRLPVAMSPEASDGPIVWVVETDELDVPWLVRLRVGTE